MRRASLVQTLRRGSMRRSSLRRTSLVPASTSLDLPWDLLDRLLIPILCCHAAAIILSGILNLLNISDVSCLTLFAWFALSTGGAILFYHHLKVCTIHKFVYMCLVYIFSTVYLNPPIHQTIYFVVVVVVDIVDCTLTFNVAFSGSHCASYTNNTLNTPFST